MDFIDEIIDKTFSSMYPDKLVSVVSKIASPKGEIPLHRTGNGHVFYDVPGNFVDFVVLLLYLPLHYM